MFLTPPEIEQLTGYKVGKKQCQWLENHGWVFEVNSHGRPVVSKAYFDSRMGGKQDEGNKRWELRFAS